MSAAGKAYTIVSSLAGGRDFEDAAEQLGFDFRIVNRKRIFFEDLAVYELSLRTEG